jgi:hypothetical protein
MAWSVVGQHLKDLVAEFDCPGDAHFLADEVVCHGRVFCMRVMFMIPAYEMFFYLC